MKVENTVSGGGPDLPIISNGRIRDLPAHKHNRPLSRLSVHPYIRTSAHTLGACTCFNARHTTKYSTEGGNQTQPESPKYFDSRHSINPVLDAVFSKYRLSNHRRIKDFFDLTIFQLIQADSGFHLHTAAV